MEGGKEIREEKRKKEKRRGPKTKKRGEGEKNGRWVQTMRYRTYLRIHIS